MILKTVSEVCGTQPDTPECQYVRTPLSGTTSDIKEQQCLRTPATDVFGDDRLNTLSKVYFLGDARERGPKAQRNQTNFSVLLGPSSHL